MRRQISHSSGCGYYWNFNFILYLLSRFKKIQVSISTKVSFSFDHAFSLYIKLVFLVKLVKLKLHIIGNGVGAFYKPCPASLKWRCHKPQDSNGRVSPRRLGGCTEVYTNGIYWLFPGQSLFELGLGGLDYPVIPECGSAAAHCLLRRWWVKGWRLLSGL